MPPAGRPASSSVRPFAGAGPRRLHHRPQLAAQAPDPADRGLLGERVAQRLLALTQLTQQFRGAGPVEFVAGLQGLRDQLEQVRSPGQLRLQRGRPVGCRFGQSAGITGEHQDVPPCSDCLVQQHPVRLDARSVIMAGAVQHLGDAADGRPERRAAAGVDRVRGQVGQLPVEAGQGQPFGSVPAERPGRDRQHRLAAAAEQHQQPGVDRRLGRLRVVPEHQGGGSRRKPDLSRTRAGAEQQAGTEAEHRQQQRRGRQVMPEGGGQAGGEPGGGCGAEHPDQPQPVRPGTVGEGRLQRADRRRHAGERVSERGRHRQRHEQADRVAARDHRVGLAQVQVGGIGVEPSQRAGHPPHRRIGTRHSIRR